MIYIFRRERAEEVRLSNHRVDLVEFVRGRWRPDREDILLVTAGNNLELIFQLAVRVDKVSEQEATVDEVDGFRLTIHGEVVVEPGVRLGQMMYSLRRVSNFARPGLNVRHHSRVLDDDYKRIVSRDVHARRSIYFGILQRLPPLWRDVIDLTARQRLARHALRQGPADASTGLYENDDPRWPVGALIEVLDQDILRSTRLASLAAERRQSLPMEVRGPYAEAMPNGAVSDWPERLLSLASRNAFVLQSLRDEMFNAALQQPDEGGIEWRPHRW
jgi:hypothetical protein